MKKLIIIGIIFLMFAMTSTITLGADSESKIRVGLGSGDPYGNFGGNLEFLLGDYFAISTGAGITPDDLGWSAGGRIYLAPKDCRVRPRLGYYLGSVFKKTKQYERIDGVRNYLDTTYQTATVNMAGIALDIKISDKVSLDPELLYVVSDDAEFNGDISLSMGIHW